MKSLVFLLLLFVFGFSNEVNLKKVEDNIYMVRGLDALPSLENKKRIPFMADRNASSKGWEEALKKMKNMDIRILLGGHNEPMDKSAIDYTLGYITYLRQNIKKMKEEGKFIDEIKNASQDSPYKSDAMYQQFHNANIFKVDNELDLEP